MANWTINEDNSINIELEVFDNTYELHLICVDQPPATPGRTLRVFDRRGRQITMLDDRMLPVLEEGLQVLNH